MGFSIVQKKKMHEKALKIIAKDANVLFIDSVCQRIGISKKTFYQWWEKGSAEYDAIWEALNQNRCIVKDDIRAKLRESGKATELLALYRMICTDEERKAISTSYTDVTSDGKAMQTTIEIVMPKKAEE